MIAKFVFLALVGGALSANRTNSIEDALSRRPHYSMLLDLLKTSNLLGQLEGMHNITLFAPTNNALSSIPSDEYSALKGDNRELKKFLQYHVTSDEAWRAGGKGDNDQVLTSLNGLPIRINVYKLLHTFSAEGCNVTDKNIGVMPGIIQGLDCVMNAPNGDVVNVIGSNPETSQLSTLISDAGLGAALRADKNITVFAPTDAAWNKLAPEVRTYLQQNPALLKEVLLYHVVPKTTLYSIGMRHSMVFQTSDHDKDSLVLLESNDGDLFINHAKINQRDLSATNGVVHTVDDFILPAKVLVELEDQGFGHLLG